MSYTAEERETVIRIDDLTDDWIVYTAQRKVITKLKKIRNLVVISEELGENGNVVAGTYKIPYRQVSFRNPSIINDEMKEKRARILREYREKSN